MESLLAFSKKKAPGLDWISEWLTSTFGNLGWFYRRPIDGCNCGALGLCEKDVTKANSFLGSCLGGVVVSSAYRPISLRVCSVYRAASDESVWVITEMIALDLLVDETHYQNVGVNLSEVISDFRKPIKKELYRR